EIAGALSLRGLIEMCVGDADSGMRALRRAFELSRPLHPVRFASVQIYAAIPSILGVADAADLVDDARTAWELAEAFGDICGIVMAGWAYGTLLVRAPDSYDDGIALLRTTRATVHQHRLGECAMATVATDLALDAARAGHVDEAIEELRKVFENGLSGFPTLVVFSAEAL